MFGGAQSASGSEPRLLARQMPQAFPQGGFTPPEDVKSGVPQNARVLRGDPPVSKPAFSNRLRKLMALADS